MVEDTRLNTNTEQEEEGLNLLELWYIVLKRWRLTFFVLIVLLIGSTLFIYTYIQNQAPIYSSKTKITLGSDALKIKNDSGDIIQRIYNISSEVLLLRSNIIAEQAANILKSKHNYEESDEELIHMVRRALNKGVGFEEIDVYGKETPGIVRGSRQLRQDESTIIISAYTESPQLSFDIVSAVLEGYIKEKAESESKFFQDTYRTFRQQLDVAFQDLIEAENKLSEYIIANEEIITSMEDLGLKDAKDKNIISSTVNELYVKLKKDIIDKEVFLDKLKTTAKSDIISAYDIIERETEARLSGRLMESLFQQEQNLTRLLQINEERHPAVIQARAEVEALRGKINKEVQTVIGDLETDIKGLKEQENTITKLIKEGLYQKVIEYSMLKTDVITKRKAYDKFGEALHKIDIGEKMKRYAEIKVLEPHMLPQTSEKTIPVQQILMGLMLSFGGSMGLAYLLEKLDRSIKDVKELERLTHKPVIATIPCYRG